MKPKLLSDRGSRHKSLMACSNCNTVAFEFEDVKMGESYCSQCGFVTMERIPLNYRRNLHLNTRLAFNEEDWDYMDYLIVKSKNKRLNQSNFLGRSLKDKRDWKLEEYFEYIGVVHSTFQMTEYQKNQVWNFLRNHPNLKKLHSRANYKQLITALSIYYMKKDGRLLYFNRKKMSKDQLKFLGEVKLDNKLYKHIVNRVKLLEDESDKKDKKDKKNGGIRYD